VYFISRLLVLYVGLVIISAFIPLYSALNAEHHIIHILLETIARLLTW